MSKLPRYDPLRLENDFKNLAFQQSPQFRYGDINEIYTEQRYVLNFDQELAELDDRDHMYIKFGLVATRLAIASDKDGKSLGDDYEFEIICEASKEGLSAYDLNLSPTEWQRLDEENAITDPEQDLTDEAIAAAVRSTLINEKASISRYMVLEYKFSTADHQLGLDEWSGYDIEGEYYGEVGRDDFYGQDGRTPLVFESPISDQFADTVTDLSDDIEENGDLVSPEQKQFEARILIESIAKRRLRGL